MGLIENDPRDTGFIALFVAVVWHVQLTPEQAWRLAQGISTMKKPIRELSPEAMAAINKIIRNPIFKKWDNIEKQYRIDRYTIFEELKRQKAM